MQHCLLSALLPLLSDVKHHDHSITVLVHIQKLSIQGQFRLCLETEGRKAKTVSLANPILVALQTPEKCRLGLF
jgi:ferritin-like protein